MALDSLARKIIVVGGGTAGWLTALHAKRAFGDFADVSLIESPNVPTIGVGEGTQPTLRFHFKNLGINEADCLRETGASFKNGIQFDGWGTGRPKDRYLHPFFTGTKGERTSPKARYHLWQTLRSQGQYDVGNLEDLFAESELMQQKKSPIAYKNGKQLNPPPANYAFHVDAARLGLFLRKYALQHGTKHISDHVTGVVKKDDGSIESVVTTQNGNIEGEIFIDCTGFHRLLIGELTDDFVDFGQWLLNDRAVTTRLQNDEKEPINPFTTSTAMKYGWTWNVPLLERKGIGYVFSSSFVSEDAAAEELRNFLGLDTIDANVVRFKTGYYRKQWVKNCVAIGLSGGFIEPLEATGIALITYSLLRLFELWPTNQFPQSQIEKFNQVMGNSFEWVKDFIVMHYCLSNRRDTEYWKAVTNDSAIPESVRQNLDDLGRKWPFGDVSDSKNGYTLPTASLACVLAGFNHVPTLANPYLVGVPIGEVKASFDQYAMQANQVSVFCADHRKYLEVVCAKSLPA